jgi:hypothetical protein
LPGVRIPSYAVALRPPEPAASPGAVVNGWAASLRAGTPSVLAMVRDGALRLDVLALMPGDDRDVVAAVRAAAAPPAP